MTPLEFHLNQNLQVRLGQLRGEKGSASPPRRRWKEMAGHKSKFENAQYPVDTADIYGSFSFVGLKANKKECALWSHSTWARAQALKRAQGGP